MVPARTLLATGFSRNNDYARTYPYTMFHGHLVCLLDENSASDGDIFPAMFREAGLRMDYRKPGDKPPKT